MNTFYPAKLYASVRDKQATKIVFLMDSCGLREAKTNKSYPRTQRMTYCKCGTFLISGPDIRASTENAQIGGDPTARDQRVFNSFRAGMETGTVRARSGSCFLFWMESKSISMAWPVLGGT
jgi:hypothetical protein